jgi:AraC-like DNA-binding protein
MNRFTESVRTLRSILSLFHQRGLDESGVLTAAGFSRAALDDPGLRLSWEQSQSVWKAALQLCPDPYLALHVAEVTPYGSYGAVDYICQAAPTVCEAVRRLCNYYPLVNNCVILEAEPGSDECVLYLGSQVGKLPPLMINFILASIVLHTRSGWRLNWIPERVEFPYAEPDDLSEYRRIFRCPLRFERPVAQLVMPRALWESPLPTSDPHLLKVLEERATNLLALHPPPQDTEARVRACLGSKIRDGEPSLQTVAEELGFSPRNLQRRLRSVGRSYSVILDDLRLQTAKYYLCDPEVRVGEVAGKVGFEEVSSFTRAFRRWTGSTPREYRKKFIPH